MDEGAGREERGGYTRVRFRMGGWKAASTRPGEAGGPSAPSMLIRDDKHTCRLPGPCN